MRAACQCVRTRRIRSTTAVRPLKPRHIPAWRRSGKGTVVGGSHHRHPHVVEDLMKRTFLGALCALLTLATSGFAMFMGLPEAPVDRLIKNTTAFVKEHPDDAMGPYTLARIHYLAFAKRTSQLGVIEYGE